MLGSRIESASLLRCKGGATHSPDPANQLGARAGDLRGMTKGNYRWRRSALVRLERAFTLADDDWTLVDEAGVRLARIFCPGVDNDGPVALAYPPGENGEVSVRRLRLSENECSFIRCR